MKSTIHKVYGWVAFRSKICRKLNLDLIRIVRENTTYKSNLNSIIECINFRK